MALTAHRAGTALFAARPLGAHATAAAICTGHGLCAELEVAGNARLGAWTRMFGCVLAASYFALAPTSDAQDAVPVEQTAYHVPVLSNDYVRVLNVFIPSGRTSGFHRHILDTIGVQIEDTARTGQLPNGPVNNSQIRQPGTVQFARYSQTPAVHAVSVTGDGVFHNIVIELLRPAVYGFAPGSRDHAPEYAIELDNERVRAWKLILAPGQQAAPIKQAAPGLRVIVRGGEIVESVPGRDARGMAPNAGEFYWQDGDVTRTVRNVGASPIEFVEIELK